MARGAANALSLKAFATVWRHRSYAFTYSAHLLRPLLVAPLNAYAFLPVQRSLISADIAFRAAASGDTPANAANSTHGIKAA